MTERKFTILTPEQEALIPVYQEKWKAIDHRSDKMGQLGH